MLNGTKFEDSSILDFVYSPFFEELGSRKGSGREKVGDDKELFHCHVILSSDLL